MGVLADFMVVHITLHPSAGPVKDVRLRNLEEAMLHQFFLNDVLNILDVDKCLACAHSTPAHFIGNLNCRFRIRKERKALRIATSILEEFRNHLPTSANQANLGAIYRSIGDNIPFPDEPWLDREKTRLLAHRRHRFQPMLFDQFMELVEGGGGHRLPPLVPTARLSDWRRAGRTPPRAPGSLGCIFPFLP